MGLNLMGTLGLENVEADPNAIPDGKYDGVVHDSAYVFVKAKGTISHVITYKVTDGDFKGAQRQEWFTLGNNCVDEQGNAIDSIEEFANYTNTQSDTQKQWYKKRFVDLGINEDQVHLTPVESLVGTPVTFGVKRNNGYVNVNFVERRDGAVETAAVPASLGDTATSSPAQSQPQQAAVNPIAGGLV